MSDQAETLSEREIEILRLVATGASNKEIAANLVISPNTVKVHLRNIFAKVGVASRTEATLYAIKNGLVAQPANPDGGNASLAPAQPIEEEIYLASPIAVTVEAEQSYREIPRRRKLPLWMGAAVTILILIILFGSGYAFWTLSRQPASTPAPPKTNPNAIPPRWTVETDLPKAVSGMGMSLYEGKYYLIGGSDGRSPLNKVYRYNPADKTWESLADKPTSTSQIRAALIGERIYVPGGRTANGKPSDIFEVFDPRHNTWESKQPLPVAISDYALAPYDGKLYLFGGFDGNGYSSGVYIYNPDTDTWKKGTPLPSGRSFASADAIEGKILVCGGFDGKQALSDVLIYYPNRDSSGETAWENGPNLPQARYGANSTSLANTVYLFGGVSTDPKLTGKNDLGGLVLAADQAKWTVIDQAPHSVGGDGIALASGNFIHIFGGGSQNTPSSQHLVYQAIYTIAIPLTTGQ